MEPMVLAVHLDVELQRVLVMLIVDLVFGGQLVVFHPLQLAGTQPFPNTDLFAFVIIAAYRNPVPSVVVLLYHQATFFNIFLPLFVRLEGHIGVVGFTKTLQTHPCHHLEGVQASNTTQTPLIQSDTTKTSTVPPVTCVHCNTVQHVLMYS